MKYFIGIDNSSLDHKVRVIDENGKHILSFAIQNSYEGFEEFCSKIKKFKDIKIGFELPHGPLIDYLHAKGYTLYSINPLKIKRFKESLKVSGNKDDNIDAYAIAEYLRINARHVRELLFNSPDVERLKTLSIIHSRLTRNHARHINKLHFVVRQYFPLQERLFRKFGCKTQLKMLLKYPALADLSSAFDDEITNFLKMNKYRVQKNIDKLIDKIRTHKQLISPDIEYAYKIEAKCLCRLLLIQGEEMDQIAREMKQITDNHHLGNCFQSIPGSGDIFSCKIFALFGDNKDRFDNYNGVQCLFGTAPRNYQSGPYHKVIMRKACNKSARAILYQFAFASLRYSQWARKYYDDQRSRGKTHSVALRALSNKWVKVIYKLWKDEIFYEEEKYFSSVA